MVLHRAHINPDLLVWARESLNLSVDGAAKQLHIPVMRLMEWENGVEQPTIDQLREASRVYKRPLAAFFLPSPPSDFRVPHDYRRVAESEAQPLSPEFITEYRLAQYRRGLAIELAEHNEDAHCPFVAQLRLNANASAAAARVREQLSISIEEQFRWRTAYDALNAWREAIERWSALVFQFSKVAVEEVRGFAIAEPDFPVIGINGSDTPNARIFSMMHELGHLMLGRSGVSDLRLLHDTPRDPDWKVEMFCNRFAAELLVPANVLNSRPIVQHATDASIWNADDVTDLSNQFHVSRAVIVRRLFDLGKFSEPYFQRAYIDYSQPGPDDTRGGTPILKIPQKAIRSSGKPFVRLVLDAYDRERITTADLAEYLGVRLKHLPDIRELVRRSIGGGV